MSVVVGEILINSNIIIILKNIQFTLYSAKLVKIL